MSDKVYESEVRTNPIPTVEGIVDDIISKLEVHEKAHIANGTLSDARGYHHSFGTWIRNYYGLWHTNPLTERWRDQGPNDLRNGVDYSEDHPDQMSDKIIQRLWHKLQGL